MRRRWPRSAGPCRCRPGRRAASCAYLPYFWGIWSFSRQQAGGEGAAGIPVASATQAETQTTTSNGYDIPPFQSMTDFPIWETEGPPVGTVYNYPLQAAPPGDARRSPSRRRRPELARADLQPGAQHQGDRAHRPGRRDASDQALAWLERELDQHPPRRLTPGRARAGGTAPPVRRRHYQGRAAWQPTAAWPLQRRIAASAAVARTRCSASRGAGRPSPS